MGKWCSRVAAGLLCLFLVTDCFASASLRAYAFEGEAEQFVYSDEEEIIIEDSDQDEEVSEEITEKITEDISDELSEDIFQAEFFFPDIPDDDDHEEKSF